jgi:D-alanyl-lipoteichoic acid acyltransferase DltB (MBOAT superfamily)
LISFNSPGFYALVALCFLAYQQVCSQHLRRILLSAINLLFLTLIFYFEKKQLLLLLAFILFQYGGLRLMRGMRKKRRMMAYGLIVAATLFFLFFKYTLFQAASVAMFPELKSLIQPLGFLGISFFAFRLISLILDQLDNEAADTEEDPGGIDLFHVFNYLTFFPTWLSGPLDRYEDFVKHSEHSGPQPAPEIYAAVFRIIVGAFKKLGIADTLLPLSLDSMSNLDVARFPLWKCALSAYVYIFVLYIDFSGYSDMAIGISRLFGIQTPENFNHPLVARNIQEFWSRWHMSLTHWLRDYIFYPLLKTLTRTRWWSPTMNSCLAFLITFAIAGVWHGDGRNFLYFGVYQGVLFCTWFLFQKLLETCCSSDSYNAYLNSRPIRWAATFLTFNCYTVGLVLFTGKLSWFSAVWKGLST